MAAAWRDRRRQQVPLDLWEAMAEEFEEAGHVLPPEFDTLAADYLTKKAAYEQDAGEQLPWQTAKRAVEQQLFRHLDEVPRTALCFSGGGVRSCTFGLGVLQGLARAWLTTSN